MQYAWLVWSLILLAVWSVVYLSLKDKISKREMLTVSLWTSLLGLTEPIFVPEYWNPPSLFNLAQVSGFDIESLLFAFGIGGLAAVIYERLFRVGHLRISRLERLRLRHKYHLWVLLSTPIIFAIFFIFTNLNPIYSTIAALIGGGLATWYCRPDLKKKMLTSAFVFLGFYFVFFFTLVASYPDFVGKVWNLSAISGILILGVPLEELIFAWALGWLWSSVYEHISWRRLIKI